MAKKTNKTSHVMDLLTNGASPEIDEPVNETPSAPEKKVADIQSHTVTPAKVTVVDEGSRNDRLSQEILGKLTEELEEETRQDLETRKAESQPETDLTNTDSPKTPAETADSHEDHEAVSLEETHEAHIEEEETKAVQETQSTDIDVQQAPEPEEFNTDQEPDITADRETTQPQKSADTASPAPSPQKQHHPIIPDSQLDNRFIDKEYRFINVMEQLLMRQNLEAVLTQYEVCTCPRCMSDVCALVLTGLPSKYVVTSRDSISPLISYYENKYKIPVLTELMKACTRVRENPRHKVPQEN